MSIQIEEHAAEGIESKEDSKTYTHTYRFKATKPVNDNNERSAITILCACVCEVTLTIICDGLRVRNSSKLKVARHLPYAASASSKAHPVLLLPHQVEGMKRVRMKEKTKLN